MDSEASGGSGNMIPGGQDTLAPGLNTDLTKRQACFWTGAVYSVERTTPFGGLVSVSPSRGNPSFWRSEDTPKKPGGSYANSARCDEDGVKEGIGAGRPRSSRESGRGPENLPGQQERSYHQPGKACEDIDGTPHGKRLW